MLQPVQILGGDIAGNVLAVETRGIELLNSGLALRMAALLGPDKTACIGAPDVKFLDAFLMPGCR